MFLRNVLCEGTEIDSIIEKSNVIKAHFLPLISLNCPFLRSLLQRQKQKPSPGFVPGKFLRFEMSHFTVNSKRLVFDICCWCKCECCFLN